MIQTKILIVLLCLQIRGIWTIICSRYPSHTYAPKTPVDENYAILIQGNPQTYILGAEYRIILEASNGARFISFLLALEYDTGGLTYMNDLGSFEIIDDVETQYSENCYNMVESTNTNTKTRIEVKWIAPTEPGKGCILIRATVLHSRDVWFMDDGGLTRRICEEIVDDVESSRVTKEANACCACDEASYEILFEGLWSRNLHPKDFPAQGFLTRFSDIIGASHASDYRFWEYGQLANKGMQEFAEYGSLRTLQKEFNSYFREGKIRTIVRARGPAFPNLNGISVSTVRVDKQHHLLSLASKIDPSPDWIVGVSGMELCLANCTWLQEKTISLYPWDIGTDAGPSYLSADQPQLPPDVIRRIRHDYPNDPRCPFFDESGTPMKPLATLTVKRKRLYERDCEESELTHNKDLPKECSTHPFNDWSECSARCGSGIQWRKRVYKQPEAAKVFGCDSLTRNYLERQCQGTNCVDRLNTYQEVNSRETIRASDCKLSAWTGWSACSKTCGEGKMMRRRQFLKPDNEELCQSQHLKKLIQYKKCVGRDCLGQTDAASDEVDNLEDERQTNSFVEAKQPTWQRKNNLEEEEDHNLDYRQEEEQNPYSDLDAKQSYKNEESHDAEDYPQLPPPPQALDMHKEYRGKTRITSCCFEALQVHRCADSKAVGNFWTYNYCEDQCMLYASNNCDMNRNKFTSLEDCEATCRTAQHYSVLQEKQQEECFNAQSIYRRRSTKFSIL